MKAQHPTLLITTLAIALLAQCGGGSGGQGATPSRLGSAAGVPSTECLEDRITVWGEAPIFASRAAAREKAREDACRSAIRKCIGEQVASYSQVSDAQSIANEIFSQAQGVCRNEQIIEETTSMLDTVEMLRLFIRYEVSAVEMKEQIDIMQQLAGNPKIMVLLREEQNVRGRNPQVEGFTSSRGVSGAALRDFLVAKGYTVIDARRLGRNIDELALARSPHEIPDSIMDRIVEAGADVLIVGTVVANPQEIGHPAFAGSQMKSYRATGVVAIHSLWGSGRMIGEFTDPIVGAQVSDEAAARAAVSRFAVGGSRYPAEEPGGLAAFLHERLSREWSQITRNNLIEMRVDGLDSRELGRFRDDLVIRTETRRVNEVSITGNTAHWEVTYPGRSFALRDTIDFYRDNPRIFSIVQQSGKRPEIVETRRGFIHVVFK